MTKLLGCVYITNSNILKYDVKGYLPKAKLKNCMSAYTVHMYCIMYSRWIHGHINFQFWACTRISSQKQKKTKKPSYGAQAMSFE